MLQHYFLVATRNILKYKLQSAVSLLGLTVAFTCVSLAVYWNYYEVSFDSFHRNIDRIYRIRKIANDTHVVSQRTYGEILLPLKKDYPEIEKVCAIRPVYSDITNIDGSLILSESDVSFAHVTADLFDIFDFDWIAGNAKILSQGENRVAISEEVAKRICGNNSPLGFKFLMNEKQYEVFGVYETWSKHSNLKPDIVNVLSDYNEVFTKGAITYAMFKPNTDSEQFIRRIENDTITYWLGTFPQVLNLWTPLKKMHYTYPVNERNVHLSDVYLFTAAAVLLSLCALLNYLTLFISRIRSRGRDMALRVVCGSSIKQLGRLLMTEYLLLLLCALVFSLMLIEVVMKLFIDLSQIQVERSTIYVGCIYMLLFALVFSFLLSIIPIYYFRQKTLRVQIDSVPSRLVNTRFRPTTVCLQLAVSIFFMFCTIMMMKQIYFLLYSDFNVERKQIAVFQSLVGSNRIMDILRQIPSVKGMVPISSALFPLDSSGQVEVTSWENRTTDAHPISCQCVFINDSIASFYGLKMKEGSHSFDLNENEVLINETFANRMGVDNPIGKQIHNNKILKGIVCDFQSQSPTLPVAPIMFLRLQTAFEEDEVAFKYEGNFADCERAIVKVLKKEDIKYLLEDTESKYRELLKPEYNLLKLLGIVFIVSLLIALFGIYALVVQACEQHRKEIAIRKVSGAQITDILSLFFKQYMQQVIVAATIALPVGYMIIKHWLEGYSLQTEISLWVFIAVFICTSLLVTLCVGWHVWCAANENPAKVIRKE